MLAAVGSSIVPDRDSSAAKICDCELHHVFSKVSGGDKNLGDTMGQPSRRRALAMAIAAAIIATSPIYLTACGGGGGNGMVKSSTPTPPPSPPPPPPSSSARPIWIWAPHSASELGGDGTWSKTSSTWTDAAGSTPAPLSLQPFGMAIFKGAPGTVTVDDSNGSVGITGMDFAVDGYTLTGDELDLVATASQPGGGPAVIQVGGGDATTAGYKATINNALHGDFSKTGVGTLVLTGTNAYTYRADIQAGTLALIDQNGVAGAYAVTVDTGATLDISGATNGATVRSLDGTGSVRLGSNILTIGGSGASTFDGSISGSGGLEVSSGYAILAGVNTYTGLTTVDSGAKLQLGNGNVGSVAGDILDNGWMSFSFDDVDLTYGGVISGNGSVDKSGTGTLTLAGANAYSGGTNINSGVLQVSSDANLGANTGGVVIGNGTLRVDTNGQAVTLARGIAGVDPSEGTLVKKGAGTLTLTAPVVSSSYKFTEVDAGTLALSGGVAALGGPFLSVASGATFDISQSLNASVSISALNGNGTVALGYKSLRIEDGSDSWSFGGVIADGGIAGGAGGMMVIFQPGITGTLTGANTYTGATVIDHGALVLAGNGSIADSSLVSVVGDDATLDISGTTSGVTIKRLQGYGGAVVLGAQTLTVSDADADVVYSAISGTGGLALAGGTLTFAGTNTYTGGTTINAGATLQVGYGGTGGSIVGNVTDDGSLVFATGGPTFTFGGVISGTGSVTADTGMVTLTGVNTFSGGVTIGGTLSVAEDANLGAFGNTLVLSYGTLETTASFSTGRKIVLQNFGTIQTDSGSDLSISGDISGSGALSKEGAGTLTLTGANTYTDGTNVNSGTLQASTTLPGDADVGGGALDAVPGVAGNLFNSGKVAVHGGDTTVGGNYTNSSTGTLAVSLGSKLAVTGTATLNGGTLEVTGEDSGYGVNTHTDVLTANGGVIGTFDTLVKDSGVVFTSTTIGYGANDVYLDTTGLSITVAAKAMGIVEPAAVSAAQRVQDGFETINATTASAGTVAPDVLQGAGDIQHSATPAVAHATLTSLSGQLHAASAAMLFDGIDARSDALAGHFDDLLSGRAASGIWYGDLGWQGNLQRSGYNGATFRSDGGMAGADMRFGGHALLGVAVGQSRGFGQLDAAWDHDRTWMSNIAAYGGLMNGPWYASAQVASGWYREDMQRLLQLGALGAPVGARSTGRYVAGSLEGGRLFHIGDTRIVPFANVRYQRLALGGFTEQGGLGYGLKANDHGAGRLQAGLGLRAAHGWRLADGMRMEVDGSVGWRHTLHQYGSAFDASFTGFDNWLPVEGIGLSRNTAILRAGLSLWPARNVGLRIGCMREQDQRERAGSAMLQGTVTF